MSLHVGEAIGDYRIIGIIGAGGMGQVFQVEHKITKRREAMKVLLADLADETQMERFKREIEVQARLNHPNIAAVHNAFRLKDRLVLVLEFVEGQTLENLLLHGRPSLDIGIDYVRQTLSALCYAHERGVIHRDVSPSNLMITAGGLVKLMDFGVAKSLGDLRLTESGSMVGSLYYMSPEQVKGATDPDPRSDLYSAGAILYEITTGKRPFDYQDRFSLMVAQVEEQPRPPGEIEPHLPEGLDQIILKALEKEPGRRFASAQDFLNALNALKGAQPVSAAQPAAPSRRRVLRVGVAAAGIAACALVGITALSWDRFQEPLPPPAGVFQTPRPPVTLAGIPPAPPSIPAAPAAESVPAQPAISVRQAAAKRVAAKPKVEPPPQPDVERITVTPTEPAGTDTMPLIDPKQAEQTLPAVQETPDASPQEPKKRGFWVKLNPFRAKTGPFKKKKSDSALRSTSDPAAERQD